MTALEAAPIRDERAQDILSDDALAFLAELHGRFNPRRLELLQARKQRGAPSGFQLGRAHGRFAPLIERSSRVMG